MAFLSARINYCLFSPKMYWKCQISFEWLCQEIALKFVFYLRISSLYSSSFSFVFLPFSIFSIIPISFSSFSFLSLSSLLSRFSAFSRTSLFLTSSTILLLSYTFCSLLPHPNNLAKPIPLAFFAAFFLLRFSRTFPLS